MFVFEELLQLGVTDLCSDEQLAERIEQLAERIEQLAERIEQLAERIEQLAERIEQLAERVAVNLYLLELLFRL